MSKQYKLIKKYPSLADDWEVGMIVGQGDRGSYGNYSPCHGKYSNRHISSYEIHNHPEFWEEVTEKTYEILSVLQPHVNSKYILIKNKSFGISYVGDVYYCNGAKIRGFDMMDKIKYSNWKIHSVKRLSDSEVFTVGDRVDSTISDLGRPTELTGFKIIDNKLTFGLRNLGYYPLCTILKPKKPLFTTEDGVDIFEGGCFYSVCKQDLRITSDKPINEVSIIGSNRIWDGSDGYLQFSSKEKAEEYILLNKPCLSINDIQNFDNSTYHYIKVDRDKLKELVKSKLCK
jgi:hypothetical protein